MSCDPIGDMTAPEPLYVVTLAQLQTVSEANQRGMAIAKAGRVRGQRTTAYGKLRSKYPTPPKPPMVVVLVRYANRALDSDNLASALKAVRDGVADWLKIDDGNPGIRWVVEQEPARPRVYGVRIEVLPGAVECTSCRGRGWRHG